MKRRSLAIFPCRWRQKHTLTDSVSGSDTGESGYTLVEVLITMFILGMILLVVNLVLIAMIRVSYNTDVRIKMRQGIEFAFEVMRRNVKSADPGSLMMRPPGEVGDGEALQLELSGGDGESVAFFLESSSLGTENSALKALWQDGGTTRQVYLTSPHELNVTLFTVEVLPSPVEGTTEVVLTITADSEHKKNSDEPLIQDLVYQTSILAGNRNAL